MGRWRQAISMHQNRHSSTRGRSVRWLSRLLPVMGISVAVITLGGCRSGPGTSVAAPGHSRPAQQRRTAQRHGSASSSPSTASQTLNPTVSTTTSGTVIGPSLRVRGQLQAGSVVELTLSGIPPGYVLTTLTMRDGTLSVTTSAQAAAAQSSQPGLVGFSISPDGRIISFGFDQAMGGGTGQFVFRFQNSAGSQLTVKSPPFSIR